MLYLLWKSWFLIFYAFWEITFFVIFHLKVFLFFLMAQALHRYSREPWLIAGILFFSILIKTPIHDVKLGI